MYAEPALILTANRDHYRRFSNLIVSGHNFVVGLPNGVLKLDVNAAMRKKSNLFFKTSLRIDKDRKK